MVTAFQELGLEATDQLGVGDCWQWECLSSAQEATPILEFVAAAMTAARYPVQDIFETRLALTEAIANAIKHGNRGDSTKLVHVTYHVNDVRVLIEVEDQGDGFDPDEVMDPCAAENLERPNGRGLHLIRSAMTWVRFNEQGNGITLCKYRSL